LHALAGLLAALDDWDGGELDYGGRSKLCGTISAAHMLASNLSNRI
jgi:hypothetical protein